MVYQSLVINIKVWGPHSWISGNISLARKISVSSSLAFYFFMVKSKRCLGDRVQCRVSVSRASKKIKRVFHLPDDVVMTNIIYGVRRVLFLHMACIFYWGNFDFDIFLRILGLKYMRQESCSKKKMKTKLSILKKQVLSVNNNCTRMDFNFIVNQ